MRGLPGAIEQAIGQLYDKAQLKGARLKIKTCEVGWKKEEPFFKMAFNPLTFQERSFILYHHH